MSKPEKTSIKKILIVDDEVELRNLMKEDFEDNGFEVVTAPGGEQAVKIFDQDQFDLVISDVNMPHGNGVDLLKHIRKHGKDRPPVYFITGYADLSREEAIKLGAADVFEKPILISDLLNRITADIASRAD